MQLRHIEPGSLEWSEATEDAAKGFERLSPEEMLKLRHLTKGDRGFPGFLMPPPTAPMAMHTRGPG